MGDESHVTVARPDGGDGMGHVNDKGGAAHRGVVGEAGLDAQVLGGSQGREAGGKQSVDFVLGNTGVGQGVVSRFCVVLQGRFVGNGAHLVGLGHADDGYIPLSRRTRCHFSSSYAARHRCRPAAATAVQPIFCCFAGPAGTLGSCLGLA